MPFFHPLQTVGTYLSAQYRQCRHKSCICIFEHNWGGFQEKFAGVQFGAALPRCPGGGAARWAVRQEFLTKKPAMKNMDL